MPARILGCDLCGRGPRGVHMGRSHGAWRLLITISGKGTAFEALGKHSGLDLLWFRRALRSGLAVYDLATC